MWVILLILLHLFEKIIQLIYLSYRAHTKKLNK